MTNYLTICHPHEHFSTKNQMGWMRMWQTNSYLQSSQEEWWTETGQKHRWINNNWSSENQKLGIRCITRRVLRSACIPVCLTYNVTHFLQDIMNYIEYLNATHWIYGGGAVLRTHISIQSINSKCMLSTSDGALFHGFNCCSLTNNWLVDTFRTVHPNTNANACKFIYIHSRLHEWI